MGIIQYIKDTRSELHHVAWPSRTQTVVYTAIVIALSVLVALYLGFFDYLFTTTLSRALHFLPAAQQEITFTPEQPEITISTSTSEQ